MLNWPSVFKGTWQAVVNKLNGLGFCFKHAFKTSSLSFLFSCRLCKIATVKTMSILNLRSDIANKSLSYAAHRSACLVPFSYNITHA